MKIRIISTLLIAAALTFACSPRPHTSAASSVGDGLRARSLSSLLSRDQAKKVSRKLRDSVVMTAQLDVAVQPREVEFVLDVKNDGGKRVEVNFPNGQMYDIVVVDSVGRQVWHWADGRIFTQAVQNKHLKGGSGFRISERWKTPRAGKYVAIATLLSGNYPVERRVAFELQ